MKVSINKISSQKIELEIEIPALEMENYFQLAAFKLSRQMKVDGFRPGKVPIEIVEQKKGSQTLFNEAANIGIQKTLPRAILENKIEIIGQPNILVTQIARGNPMKYRADFFIVPDIELGNYKGLKVKRKELRVENKEIDKTLDYIQKSRIKLITVNRPAKKNDRVEIDFIIQDNGLTIEKGESKNYPLVIGESRFMPGFEEKLIGMKAGEEKRFTLKVPQDWSIKNIAGKDLDIQVKMNLVQERQIPRLSDEFAQSLGDFKSLKDLKESIKEGIFQEKQIKEKERIRMELIEKVVENSKIDTSEELIDIELKKMIDEFKVNIEELGLDFNSYLNEIKKTVDDFKREWRGQAEKRVKVGLVLRAIAKREKIEVSEDEVIEKINETIKHYPGIKKAEKNIDLEALKEYTKGIIRNEKVFQLLEREAEIS